MKGRGGSKGTRSNWPCAAQPKKLSNLSNLSVRCQRRLVRSVSGAVAVESETLGAIAVESETLGVVLAQRSRCCGCGTGGRSRQPGVSSGVWRKLVNLLPK
ncbi:hypothetical protein NDU88_002371 [Pleurodeles waltl]|uniref:Uncharacterized protein n=1 Tax=Pleurodeles waltl TaxID=8319 RepID=A0AAV7MMY3_PLEWA|nr:hypothetical protein NDU88_002371 [Pleurodeles waltl]